MTTSTLPADARIKALKAIDDIFDPLISQVAIFVGRLEAAGHDPSKYFDVEENETIDYARILDERKTAKADAVKRVNDEYDSFEGPESGGSETTESAWWKLVLLIIESVLRDGVRITIAGVRWDSSKPIDGIISDVRDKVFAAIGIDPNSEVGRLLRDPLNRVQDYGVNIANETGRALENAVRETDQALQNATREAGTVINNVARETGNALSNVAREVGRVIPRRVRIKKPRITW